MLVVRTCEYRRKQIIIISCTDLVSLIALAEGLDGVVPNSVFNTKKNGAYKFGIFCLIRYSIARIIR